MTPLLDLRPGETRTISTFFQATELIGSGTFADVYKAYDQYHHIDLVLKIYREGTDQVRQLANNEVAVLDALKGLDASYFPWHKGVHIWKRYPYIVLELGQIKQKDGQVRVISLKEMVPAYGTGPEAPEVVHKSEDPLVCEFWSGDGPTRFIRHLFEAVNLMHGKEVIHRDLKPSNILVKRAPGEEQISPFILDFNTSSRKGNPRGSAGTLQYLPPEVQTRTRTAPGFEDDRWAVAVLAWEMLFGLGAPFELDLPPHALIQPRIPLGLPQVLLRALSLDPADRFTETPALLTAVEQILVPAKEAGVQQTEGLDRDTLIWAKENRGRVYQDILDTLAAGGELPISKEARDRVNFFYSMIIGPETQSVDLKEEVLRMGPRTIPALVEEGYKLDLEARSDLSEQILEALVELAGQERELAFATIDHFCVSSDYNVRTLCRRLCDRLEHFPTVWMESIIHDDLLYLPEERVAIADLCIRWSKEKLMMLALNYYMCKEYILDHDRYRDLSNRIAIRTVELSFDQKAKLIVEDTHSRVWEELPEYSALPDQVQKERADRGLLQLFGDAFASLERESLEFVKAGKLPKRCEKGKLKIERTFMRKMAERWPEAREWLITSLLKESQRSLLDIVDYPSVRRKLTEEQLRIVDAVKKVVGPDESIDLRTEMRNFLLPGAHSTPEQIKRTISRLCWQGKEQTLEILADRAGQIRDSRVTRRTLQLLAAYESRSRFKILRLLCDHWDTLAAHHLEEAIGLLGEYGVPQSIHREVVEILERYLAGAHAGTARNSLDRIL